MNLLKANSLRSVVATVIVGILFLNGWVLYSNFEKVSAQEGLVSHTAEVLSDLELIISAAKDTETGMRGYMLTHRAEFLEPYHLGQADIAQHLANFKRLTADNPAQISAIAALQNLINDREHTLDEMRVARDRGVLTMDQQMQLLVHGKTVMDQLRFQVQKMKATEEDLLKNRAVEAQKSREFFTWAVLLTTLLSTMAVAFAFWQFERHQTRLEDEAREKAHESWVRENMAEIGRIITENPVLETAARKVAEVIGRRFHLLALRVFLFESDRLRMVSEVGVESENGEDYSGGLLAEAVSHTEVWQITDVPKTHWPIKSALGSSLPKALVFMPIRFQGNTIGVIEAASFNALTDRQRAALDRVSDTIGVGFNASRSRERLQELLEETQQQSEELQTQQEELKTNNEELEQQTRALESQQQSLSVKNRELEGTRLDLEYKADELQRSSQYKSEFLAKMSHELRTPLNGMQILSTLLMENKEKNLSERQIQFAKSIYGAGNDLLTLINDILDLSKIEARKLSLRPESFKLQDLLEHKKITFAPQIEAKKLKLVVELDPKLREAVLFTDRQRMEQILRNFISNAIKFTEQGTITLKAMPTADPSMIDISVSDTGIGIPKDKQALVFEAFEQVDSSASRNFGGTGLGLTISKELALLLGGSIRLVSAEGHGSTFTLTVPVKIAAATVAERQEAARDPQLLRSRNASVSSLVFSRKSAPEHAANAKTAIANIPAGSKTILVVEDDDKFRSSILDTVKEYGFFPVEAADGDYAVALLENFTPDAVLLDVKLPGISGLGILEMIKQMPHLRHVPVHMISALDYHRNALRRGALGYLTKPVTLEKIRSAVGRIQHFIDEKIKRVLVIEDDARQRDAIASLISGQDVSVVSSNSGREAVERLKSETFDCIILDLTLPDVSGFDLLTEMNSLPISLPPVVIYTGKDLTDDEEEYLRKFSESIIIKGARSPERLLDEVNLFLHRIESLLPEEKRQMLTQMRSQDESFQGKTVLVADDDLRNVFALTSALESKGLRVLIAKNGADALDVLEKNKEIDIVLMDIMMPKMDGYEAMKRIRKSTDERVKKVPIIALTAKAMREDHEKCIAAGANDYLPKPVNLDNLVTALRVWLTSAEGF